MAMMKHLFHGIWILLFLYCTKGLCSEINDTDVPDTIKVHRKLLKYAEIVKPGAYNDTVKIVVGLYPYYLQQLDTAQQTISFVGLLGFSWYHASLAWNPSDYGGVERVSVPADKIWKPKFEILNSAVSNIFEASTLNKKEVRVLSNGWAIWSVSETFTTTCKIQPEYFPFDTQQCEMRVFGANATEYENFTASELNTIEFMATTEWTLLDSSVSNVDDPFLMMVFKFKFKRTSGFYVLTMIMPLITLSILGLLMFPLPADSGEKVSLGMTCLLSFVVIQASVTTYVPTSYSTMPYIVMLIFALMVFNALAISATIITISVLAMEPRPRMPGWLDRLVSRSGKINVQENPNSNPPEMVMEDVDAIHGSQKPPADIKTSSGCSDDPEQEQLDKKWKKFGNLTNNFLFLLFSAGLTILICAIFGVWIAGANSTI